jgi:hypothetical protein
MAPRLIPPTPTFRSKAEERVWARLRAGLGADSFLAANVTLSSHADTYEADLVVGIPEVGFAVIEVKGGPVLHTDEGWIQVTPDGDKHIDPVGQADRAKRLLDSYVHGRGWGHGPIRFEHLVAFPDVEFDERPPAPDLARWALLAKNDLEHAAEHVWTALNQRQSDKPRPEARWVLELADMLGGRPDPASRLTAAAQAREEHVRQLTEEQNQVLGYVRTNPRIRVVGGPGTGKTWLALEQARIWADSGQLVLFVCYSRGLARWVGHAVEQMPEKVGRRITVKSFHAYGVGLGIDVPDGAHQEWWDATLPALMLDKASPAYDAVVVDEAQDFADSWWPPLLASLKGDRVFVAGDEQQSVFAGRRGRPSLEMAELSLSENLRNTSQIASVFNPMASDRMRFRGGEGPPVGYVECSADDACSEADSVVDGLLASGHDPASIAVLTTGHRHPNHRFVEEQVGKDGYWDGFWMDDEVFYGTVMGFKGLERPVVVLAVDGFHDGVGRDVMYAGLSRPRDELVVCGDLEMIRAAAGEEVARRIASG